MKANTKIHFFVDFHQVNLRQQFFIKGEKYTLIHKTAKCAFAVVGSVPWWRSSSRILKNSSWKYVFSIDKVVTVKI